MTMENGCLMPSNNNAASKNVTIKSSSIDSVIAKKSPSIKWLKLSGINLLAFGLELCASAGFTYIPPIMLKSGFTDKNLTVVMGIGPFISLIIVPMIGRWSDRCTSRFGRRRPFMLFLGILMLFSLLIIPFSNDIFLKSRGIINANFALATGVILLDFSSQALMNPCKALIPDIFNSLEEQSSGFTVYSCMLSFGGCVGYFITSINWGSTSFGKFFGGQEKAVFSLLAVLLSLLLVINLSLAIEKPLEANSSFYVNSLNIVDNNFNDFVSAKDSNGKRNIFPLQDKPCCLDGFRSHSSMKENLKNCHKSFAFVKCLKLKTYVRSFRLGIRKFFCCLFLPFDIIRNYSVQECFNMPPVLFRLFVACLFGWMGIMCHDMYYSDFVGQVIYRGKPRAERESVAVGLYDEGVRMGSWGLLLHCLSSAVYAAFIQENLVQSYGKRKTYLFGMMCFSFSLLGTVLTNSLILVNVFAALSGLGLTAITTVPYSLLTEYYDAKQLYYCGDIQRGIGEDMAVLDSAFYLSQIIPSLFLGYIVEWTGSSATYMVVAASCGAAASYFAFFVIFTPQPSERNSVYNLVS